MESQPIGLKRGTVKLKHYSSRWKQVYEKEEKLLLNTLGDSIVDIQHVGSTSIPRVQAKPIIDIAVTVGSLKKVERHIKTLEGIGYKYKTDDDKQNRLFFTKGPESKRTHYLHIGTKRGDYVKDMVLFRDYLRKHGKAVKEYNKLKIALAKKFGKEREQYTEGKAEFVEKIIKIAKKRNKRISG